MADLSPAELNDIEDMVGFVPPPEFVSGETLGQWLGLTANRVHALAREGVLTREADKTYALRKSIRAYADHARNRRGSTLAQNPELNAEKVRLARANAEKVETANAKARGELLDSKRVAAEWAATVTDLRAAVLAIPQRVAGRCALDRATTLALDEEIRAALEAIADDA